MYKDVWKRFGTKILIAVCSILLLGGVAVAAPRLRAAPPNPVDINTITIPTQTQEYQVDPTKLATLKQVIDQGGTPTAAQAKIGQTHILPSSISVMINGQEETLREGTDYTISDRGDQTITEAGQKTKFTIEVRTGSSIIAGGTQGRSKEVDFEITKNTSINDGQVRAVLPDKTASDYSKEHFGQEISGNAWVVGGFPATFDAKNWTFSIWRNEASGGEIPLTLANQDITWPSSMPQATAVGGNNAYSVGNIELKNYTAKLEITASVYRDLSQGIQVEKDQANKTVTLKDGTADVPADAYNLNISPTDSSFTVEGKPSRYYIGTIEDAFDTEDIPFYPEFTDYTIDYDDAGKTIENPPSGEVINTKDNNVTLIEGTHYTIDKYYFKDGSTDWTAGTVYMDFVGMGKYRGKTITKTYELTRKLVSYEGGKNTDLTVTLEPMGDAADFKQVNGIWQAEYNGSWRAMTPKLTFKNAAGVETELVAGTDYDVTYTLNGQSNLSYTQLINAGTVFLTITGKGSYRGVLEGSAENPSLTYQITAQNIENTRELALLDSNMMPYTTYGLTANIKDDVFNHAYLQAKNYSGGARVKLTSSTISTGKVGIYKDQAGNEQIKDEDWATLRPDTDYYLRVEFTGNYTGTLSARFQVEEYDADYANIYYNACSECGATDATSHIYTGKPHELNIERVEYVNPKNGTTIPIDASVWSKAQWLAPDNTNAGTTSIDIPISDKIKKTVRFTIQKRDLTKGTIQISGEGFSRKDGVLSREYSGYETLPTVSGLTLVNTIPDNKTIQIAADEYTINGLYKYVDGKGTDRVQPSDIVADGTTQYCFAVETAGNNYTINEGKEGRAWTEPFVFTKRDIGETGETGISVVVKPSSSVSTNPDSYLSHLQNPNNVTITDNKLQQTVREQDYEINVDSLKSQLANNSSITFTIKGKGCYKGETAEIVLYVGKNITLTKLKEMNAGALPINRDASVQGEEVTTGTFTLQKGPYASVDAIPFYEGSGDIESMVSLQDPAGGVPYKTLVGSKIEKEPYDTNCNYRVSVLSRDPQPDNPNDTTGTRYAKVALIGTNGYYGTITLKVPIEKVDFKDGDYRIVFWYKDYEADDNVYTGEAVKPRYEVVKKDVADKDPATWTASDKLVKGRDYVEVKWDNNTKANEGKTGSGNLASLTITGINGFENELTQTFTIYKRNIGRWTKREIEIGGVVKEVECWVLNEAEGFRLEGWINNSRSYDYSPTTLKEDGKEENGVRPQLKLYYKNELLQLGTDYQVGYENQYQRACYSDDGMTYAKLPKIKFDTRSGNLNSNFKGNFEEHYEIAPIILTNRDQCNVRLGYRKIAFTGLPMHPSVTVTLYRNGDKTKTVDLVYDLTNDKANGNDIFDVEYLYDTFVTIGGSTTSNSQDPYITHVNIAGKNSANDQGNFQGTERLDYMIYGEFQPNGTYGKANSAMVVTPQAIKYSATATADDLKAGCIVTYMEKLNDGGDYNDAYGVKGTQHRMETSEYKVTGVRNRIGDNIDARVESTVEYFEGGQPFKMIIMGDLGADYIHYEVNPIGYNADATTVALDKFLTVWYDTPEGGKEKLSYGEDGDYVFETVPTANLGVNRVNIIPAPGAKGYLEPDSKRLITYYVTTELNALKLENVNESYPYAHGEPVIKPEDIIVTLGGQRLYRGQDYNIEILRGDQAAEAIDVGTYIIRVTSANEEKFSGQKEQTFSITQYDLEDAVKDDILTVVYDETPEYRMGEIVMPDVTSVTVKTKSGNTYTLSNGKGDKEAEYAVAPGNEGDNVNWTRGDVKPNFFISGRGNYRGNVSLKYSIRRKNIKDVEITPIEDLNYDNGKDITPVPLLRYRDKDLRGVLFSGNANDYVDWKDYTTHYTYQYGTDIDLKSVGTKSILITGIGNFTGNTSITYTVKPLDLSQTDLIFTGETPVYDGTRQMPAFKLTYRGTDILVWTGNRVISDYIKSAEVVFSENNINATGDEPATVTVRITGENDNYVKEKSSPFAILPASLASHTKFLYHPAGENGNVDLKNYKLNLDFIGVGSTVKPAYAAAEGDLEEGQVGIYFDYSEKANHNAFLMLDQDYTIAYKYVEPDTDDVDIREEYQDPDISYAGKVKVTITGKGNYADEASYWYYIGKDISTDARISMNPTTAVYNSQAQYPTVTVSGVDGLKYVIANYRGEVAVGNLIGEEDFVNAGEYLIRIEGDPRQGTYATKPYTLTYTITPRPLSNSLVIDGFKKEYSYTGYEICPVGISVTDYIDRTKYRLTEGLDYSLTYTNNLNAGTAYINIKAENNFSGTATASFLITSSTISSGITNGWNSFIDQGTGEISGSMAVTPNNVSLTMDTTDAMYYTGRAVYPKVSIAGMTENIDYTVTFSNNVEVGTAVATITGIGNNTGIITKNFRIIAQLSKCTISPIPAQQYTGSPVTPTLTVRCGNSILIEGTDYTVSYANNVNIGTATATLRALNNANYTGTTTATFSIANDVGGFIISGYAPSYTYTGEAITPSVVVETGSRTLVPGTDYTISYTNNVNAGTATITVTGIGRYSGTQTATFVIQPKNIQGCDTTDIADRTYTGDAYTPDITVSDSGKVLKNGIDYTVTYTNNTNPGMASILIKGANSNYSGTKVISFKIAAVAVKGLKASSVKYSSLKLKWTKQGYADGYQVCDKNSKVIKNVSTNSANITGLKAGTTYKYKVRSFIRNADGTRSYGAFSSVLNATTKLRTPTVKVASNAKGQARISWSKVSGASGYEIYYKKSSSAKYKKLKTVNNANIRVCTVRGMKSGDRAYFRVRAFKKNGSKKVYSALNPLKVITVK